MDTTELRAASKRLVKFHGRIAPLFGRPEPQEHALGYLRGLLLGTDGKSVEPMALVFGGSSPDQVEIKQPIALAWQRFLTVSPWEAQEVQQELQAMFNEEFVPTASQSPIGTVGVIDESSFVKRGTESVGVQRDPEHSNITRQQWKSEAGRDQPAAFWGDSHGESSSPCVPVYTRIL